MNKQEKLTIVFDFIADYLSDEVKEVKKESEDINVNSDDFTVTETEDTMKRAYTIMKRIDERDKAEASTKIAVRKATKPLEDMLAKVREKYESEQSNSATVESFKEKTGVTLDDEGKITEVKVGNLKEYVPIKSALEGSSLIEKNN